MAKNDTPPAPAEAAVTPPSEKKNPPGGKALWMGTAVGIGSAAIVAALMYTKRK